MKSSIKHNLSENLTKSDIKIYMDSNEFKTKVEKIVKDRLKDDKDLEDRIVDITGNVITQLFKTLWTKRGVWKNNLSNKSN